MERKTGKTFHEYRLGATLGLTLAIVPGVLSARPVAAQASSPSPIGFLKPTSVAGVPRGVNGPIAQLFALIQAKKWGEAASLAQNLAKSRPGDSMVFYGLGLTRIQVGNSIGAIQALRSAQRLGLNTVRLHLALGAAYMTMDQYILFEQQMQEAMRMSTANYLPHYYVGRYLESVPNDFAGALRNFDEATQLNPEDAKSWYYKGYCLEVLGRPAEARVAYETAIRLVTKKGERLSLPDQGMARLLAESEPTQALAYARRAIALEPGLDSNHFVIAKLYERLGRLPDAITELQAATRLNPSSAAPHYVLSRVYTSLGDRKSARAELSVFEKINRTYGPE